jgi:hypothetical protein
MRGKGHAARAIRRGEKMSALSFILLHSDKTPTINEWTRYQPFAVEELKQLRAELATLREAVNEAREMIEIAVESWGSRDDNYYRPDHDNAIDDMRAWIAAHPAEVKA